MKLLELVQQIDDFDEELTIYIEGDSWSGDSEVVVALEPDNGSIPPTAEGKKYFLEVDLVREVLEVWSDWRDGREPTENEMVEAVIYYARNDAYLAD